MSDKNPCPICGDDSEFLRFLDLCAERANEKWRENEMKTMIDLHKSMGFVQVVRCRDCMYCREHDMRAYGGNRDQLLCHHFSVSSGAGWPVEPDGFCKWGERRE